MGGLMQRRGGTVRHDAVAWGFARGADMRGVDVIQHCEVTGIRREDRAVSSASTPSQGLHRLQEAWPGGGSRQLDDRGQQWRAWSCPSKATCCRPSSPKASSPWLDTVVTLSASGHFYISQSDKGGLVFGGDIDGYNSYAQRGNLPVVEHVMRVRAGDDPVACRAPGCCASWGGIMDMSMDGSPIIDKTADRQSLISMPAGAMAASRRRRRRAGASPTPSPTTRRTSSIRQMRLDRFRTGYVMDETAHGAQANLH